MTKETRAQAAEREEARERLRALLPPGSTVYTVLRHVSRSGMMRHIDVYAILDGEPRWLSGYVSKATGIPRVKDALKVGGCGMDMGFHVVYTLSHALYGKGYGCIGSGCPSNDHNNPGPRRDDYTPHVASEEPGNYSNWHRDGGYALRHSRL